MVRRFDPYSLQLFVTTGDEGSIARAAAKEHIAPSALSRRMADLERAFGLPLLVRSAQGIELTEAGRVVYDGARHIEASFESLLRDVQRSAGMVAGPVRLFASASPVIGKLPERLKAFASAYPEVEIQLHERISSDTLRACLDDVADVGVCVAGDVPVRLDAWHFADDPLMVVMPRGHRLASAEALRLRQVAAFPLVIAQSGGNLDRVLKDNAAAERLQLKVAVTVNSLDGVCRMVEAGLGLAIIPQSAAAAYAGSQQFDRVPLVEAWGRRELKVLALRKSPRPPAVDALIEALKA